MPVDWNENDHSPPDFGRENAAQDRSNEKATQIALRHFFPVMWNRHPEASPPEPPEPAEIADMLAASEVAEPGDADE